MSFLGKYKKDHPSKADKLKCCRCGSEFDLTVHHVSGNHPKSAIEILCKTCHDLVDHNKNVRCYSRGMEKKYNASMDALESRWLL